MAQSTYLDLLSQGVVVFDGAMGTNLQAAEPAPSEYGGPDLAGCHDYLTLSSPQRVRDVHAAFLEVGCQVIETNTFRSNRYALADYGLSEAVPELNHAAAALAKEVAREFSTERHPRLVAGSMGPSGYLPSSLDPSLSAITWEELKEAYREQATALLEGGVDLLLIETGQDLLEVKAAIAGARAAMTASGRAVPVQAQVSLDTAGRMLLGTEALAVLVALESLKVDVLGLNCSTGPEAMREPVRLLSAEGRTPVSALPNAGMPLNEGERTRYPLDPEAMARALREFVEEFGVKVVGGCCGTTPEHLRAVVESLAAPASRVPLRPRVQSGPRRARVASGIRAVDLQQEPAPTVIGERLNAQGSRQVKELLLAGDEDGLVQVAREQERRGAHLLDLCVALTERGGEKERMRRVVRLLSQSAEAPLVIDTTEADVAVAALRQYPGRAVVNSVHLEEGRGKIDRILPHALEHGAAVVALTIDEEGMARTADRKLSVAHRIRKICVDEYGLDPASLIFDPLTFTLGTGDPEYRASAVETLRALTRIREELPGSLTLLGISNVSFGLPPRARPVLNSVFLHHAVSAGLDLAILNPAHLIPLAEIDPTIRAAAEALLLHRSDDALDRFLQLFQGTGPDASRQAEPAVLRGRPRSAAEEIRWRILHREGNGIEELVAEEVGERGGGHSAAVAVLNQVLLPAMEEVGNRFARGELILPFVLQSAEVMKRAVARLEGFLERSGDASKGTVVLATVQGDVHDIGKNLVHTILSHNGYEVVDLGKRVPVNAIVDRAAEAAADAIGLSALLVTTSKQMPLCVEELHRRGLRLPVLLGGAAIGPGFARRSAIVGDRGELYGGGVFYCKDAFDGLAVLRELTDPARRHRFLEAWAAETRDALAGGEELEKRRRGSAPSGRRPGPAPQPSVPTPPFWGARVLDALPLREVIPLIDRNALFRLHWGGRNAGGLEWERLLDEEFGPRLLRYKEEALASGTPVLRASYGFFPCWAEGEDLVVLDPDDLGRVLARFHFPRQAGPGGVCLTDFFRPADGAAGTVRQRGAPGPRSGGPGWVGGDRSDEPDVVAFQIVTLAGSEEGAGRPLQAKGEVGGQASPSTEAQAGKASHWPGGKTLTAEDYYRHGFAVRLVEAGAELVHRRIRRELGLPEERGLRYSWGYGACPDLTQHRLLFQLLPARERLGMSLTEAGALIPDLSTAALIVHHPDARYFRA